MDLKFTAFMFPGQGSQSLKMGFELAQAFPQVMDMFNQANELLGFSLSKIMWEGPEDLLNDTINTQPALLLHSASALLVLSEKWQESGPAYVAGHSMGEISALLGARVVPFQNALRLAHTRGMLMKQAGETAPGGMAAIIGLDIPTLEDICSNATRPGEIVQVANDNCPGQVVISGKSEALDRAVELAQAAGARRAVRLAVSIAAHSPLMSTAQIDFNNALEQADIGEPELPIIGNVSAQPLNTAADIRLDLSGQLTNRVRWTESIQYMINQGVHTFIEIGAGTVLTGLVKRINRDVTCYNLGTPEDFEKIQ